MGKRSRNAAEAAEASTNVTTKSKKSALWNEKSVDPTLAQLFASSGGPVQAPPKARYTELLPARAQDADLNSEDDSEGGSELSDGEEKDELSSVDEDLDDADVGDLSEGDEESDEGVQIEQLLEAHKPDRKRKRKAQEEDVEGKYMQKLMKEEEKEEAERQAERKIKRQRLEKQADEGSEAESQEDAYSDDAISEDSDNEDEGKAATSERIAPDDIPVHESLAQSTDTHASELEKATRTVFLANVCSSAISSKSAKKTLLNHMGSFLSSLPPPPSGKPAPKVESIRFRSTAYSTLSLPKKAAFAKRELGTATTKSTNAYVVYSNAFAAREATKQLNGTMILDRHLRVDGVAHPAKTEHTRCVFVGNLGFVDDESKLEEGGENERKRSKVPSDIEEGLWRQFSKAGKVESVRVVRDEKTRVGKGFAYVQFYDPNSVEAALLFNDKKYPPMLPRVLRVVRAKAVKKTALAVAASRENFKKSQKSPNPNKSQIYNPKLSSEASSLKGRAGRLLGRAGAANFKKEGSGANGMSLGNRGSGGKEIEGIAKTPEKIVFEGYRASSKNGRPKDLKMGGGGGKKSAGKPRTRSTKRATDWKKGGGRAKK